jgi:NAD(P)-dependent dehydrogenase (short-subunit alcohol dehydrogenase family)
LIIGGTGQVGAAVVRALAAEPSCAEVVMVNRKSIPPTADPRLRQVILDTAATQFSADVTTLAQSMVAQGDAVYGASCVGVGKGSLQWSEEALKALEMGWSVALRVDVTLEGSPGLRSFPRQAATQRAGFAIRESWG